MARDDGPHYVAFGVAVALVLGLLGARVSVDLEAPGLWFWYPAVGGLGLFTLLSFGALRAAFRPQNWLLRIGRQGLWLKFRSYLNYRLPAADAVVVHVPSRTIAWTAGGSATLDVPGSDGATTSLRMRALGVPALYGHSLTEAKAFVDALEGR